MSEIEAYFLNKIEVREQNTKKNEMIQYNHGYRTHRPNTLTVITGVISIAAFASCVVVPVGILLSGTSPLPSLVTAITRKSFKIFTLKQEKHDAIKLLAQGKLDITANIISQVMQCSDCYCQDQSRKLDYNNGFVLQLTDIQHR